MDVGDSQDVELLEMQETSTLAQGPLALVRHCMTPH